MKLKGSVRLQKELLPALNYQTKHQLIVKDADPVQVLSLLACSHAGR